VLSANFFPLDGGLQDSFSRLLSQVYEFDLKNPQAMEAYLKAAKGDFELAKKKSDQQLKAKNNPTGVKFFFTKITDRAEGRSQVTQNMALFKNEYQVTEDESDIEIIENQTQEKFYILETNSQREWNWSDALTGKDEEKSLLTGTLKVDKVKSKSSKATEYVFIKEDNPYYLTVNYSINDKYVEAEELKERYKKLRFFLLMPLEGLPEIDLRDQEMLAEKRRRNFLSNDQESQNFLHVTPTFLGKMQVDATVMFDTNVLEMILAQPKK
jgi:hypothetical protein